MNNITKLIQLKQAPVIEEKLKNIGLEAQKKIDTALSMAVTPETKPAVKGIRASLNADFKLLEDARKAVENQIDEALKPFRDTHNTYIKSVFKDADAKLKERITEVEDEEKRIKLDNLKTYFDEATLANNVEDFIVFERVIPKVDLSKSETAYRKIIDSAVEQTVKDLEVINRHEHSAELMVEYLKNFDLADAIVTVTDRRTRIEELTQKAKDYCDKVEQEQAVVEEVDEVLSAPAIVEEEDEEIYTMTFTVQGTKTQLKELKEFLVKVGMYNE